MKNHKTIKKLYFKIYFKKINTIIVIKTKT